MPKEVNLSGSYNIIGSQNSININSTENSLPEKKSNSKFDTRSMTSQDQNIEKDQALAQVFISYSRKDKRYLEELKRHLHSIESNICFWDDSMIKPGVKWESELLNALNNAKVSIILVSADFLASTYIRQVELPHLLELANNNKCTILPLIIGHSLFLESQDLNLYQAVNSPDKPLSELSKSKRDKVYVSITKEVKRLLTERPPNKS